MKKNCGYLQIDHIDINQHRNQRKKKICKNLIFRNFSIHIIFREEKRKKERNKQMHIIFQLILALNYIFQYNCNNLTPIQISSQIYYITDTNSIFYRGTDNIVKISMLDTQGRVTSTYNLIGLNFKIANLVRLFTTDQQKNIVYACEQNQKYYYIIDFNKMQNGSPSFFTQNYYPQLVFPCSNFIVQKLVNINFKIFFKQTN
ncbi:hypothetical protein TTHERM_000860540 (macronuclear) [Tetrahymena thermophila SB210]|uniref:Uncharacterized protein n=1 Tax=Tetrahymena thermophila (strain SB210) TaxID=312017 RepID=W7XHX4_TETTS|nr:hypothetical protein TTHERM_000860540 [Tetrahymena thermophila SB210]EWS74141.1 hypothetical protein TTHERM_000860540 [Tetrahymena thermophila SB210]|eukprot:XP_012653326.1 hypothetical protein TTHERM_000860540 [Tetrahymena thermophila SB210]